MIGTIAFSLLVYLYATDSLTLGRFFAIAAVAIFIKALEMYPTVRDHHADIMREIKRGREEREQRQEHARSQSVAPANSAHVKLSTIVTLRNLLLAHHNARTTESGYAQSRTAEQTNETIAVLNDYLDKRN